MKKSLVGSEKRIFCRFVFFFCGEKNIIFRFGVDYELLTPKTRKVMTKLRFENEKIYEIVHFSVFPLCFLLKCIEMLDIFFGLIPSNDHISELRWSWLGNQSIGTFGTMSRTTFPRV